MSGVFNHSNGGTLPGLDDAATAQRGHACALLPQTCSGKTLNLLSQRVHDQAGHRQTGVQQRRLDRAELGESGEKVQTGCGCGEYLGRNAEEKKS